VGCGGEDEILAPPPHIYQKNIRKEGSKEGVGYRLV